MNDRDLQHPVIARTERDGLPDREPICPVCGAGCDRIYRDGRTRQILGCEICIDEQNAWEAKECFPEKEQKYVI